LGFANHGHGGEVEGGEGFAGRQAGLVKMALEPSAGPFGDFVLGKGTKEAGSRPVRLRELFDGGLRVF